MKRVCCWGTYDLLHQGHVEFLKEAKKQGDYLMVVVISDETVWNNKGRYPKEKQEERARKIEKTKISDKVIRVGENFERNLKIIAGLKPNLFVFGHDQKSEVDKKLRRFFEQKGIKMRYLRLKEFEQGVHTSDIIGCGNKKMAKRSG